MQESDRLRPLGLTVDPEHRALICVVCGCALSCSGCQVTSHLWEKHQVPKEARIGITSYIHSLRLLDPSKLTPRPNGLPAHANLKTKRGYACKLCDYLTASEECMVRHLSRTHDHRSTRQFENFCDDVYLQSWAHGPPYQYWKVVGDASITSPELNPPSTHLEAIHQEEIIRMAKEACGIFSASSESETIGLEGITPWMNRTQWAETYKGIRRDILSRLAYIGNLRFHNLDYHIGHHRGADLISPRFDEQRIRRLIIAVDRMFDRCEETMRRTGRPILRWLRSTIPNQCYRTPFEFLGRNSSRQKYRRYWKRFIAFAFRLYRMTPALQQAMLGKGLTKRELDALRTVWNDECWDQLEGERVRPTSLEENEEEHSDADENSRSSHEESEGESVRECGSECGSDSGLDIERECPKDGFEYLHLDTAKDPTDGRGKIKGCMNKMTASIRDEDDRLSELIFRLSVAFATEEFTDGQPRSSLLVYFSGVLGFSECNQTFRRAKDFTSCLSGLIYLLRLLFLEYALPCSSYTHIGLKQRPSRGHLERLDQVRLRYMISGCLTPLAEFQDLRDFGRTLSRSDTPSFMVHWSDDSTTMHYQNSSMTITQFKEFTHRLLASAEALVKKLMYNWLPEVDLGKVKDELCNTRRGFSFVTHPENGLTNAYLQLSTRACLDRANGLLSDNQWNVSAVFRYLKRKEVLLESLLVVMYVLAGQGPRSTELLSLQHCNGPFGERGVYIHNGYVIYIARHHKARRNTNKEFNVVRYLPWAAGRLLFYYLVYIGPFTEMLKRQVSIASSKPGSSMLFSSDYCPEQPWSSHRLTAILKKTSFGLFEMPIGIRLYRQLSIAITEKHIKSGAAPFNIYDDKSPNADIGVIFAWQSCHRPLQRATTYGLDGAFPTKLQPALLRAYEYASVKWHEFLEHQSKGDVPYRKRPPLVPLLNSSSQRREGNAAMSEKKIKNNEKCTKRGLSPETQFLEYPAENAINQPLTKRVCLTHNCHEGSEPSDQLSRDPPNRKKSVSATSEEKALGVVSQRLSIQRHPNQYPEHDRDSRENISRDKRVKNAERQELDISSWITYNTAHRVVICLPCKHGLRPDLGIKRHFKDMHADWPLKLRKAIVQYTSTLCLTQPDEVVDPNPRNSPIPGLQVSNGWRCNQCMYVCQSEGTMRHHSQEKHKWLRAHGCQWTTATVQTFFQGNKRRYFEVLDG